MPEETTTAETTTDAPETPDTGTRKETGSADLESRIAAAQAEVEKWKGLARKHEDRAKANAADASKAKTVEQQLSELQQRLSDRDAADAQKTAVLASEKLTARLVRAGLTDEDATVIAANVDASRLVKDGSPDAKAIDELAASLAKVASRPAPDPDQGRKNGSVPADMNALIRQAAGRV